MYDPKFEQDFIKHIPSKLKETYLKFSNGGTAVPLIIQSLYVEEWITDEFDIDYVYENLFPNDLLKDSIII
jgi:hypothetical protein